MLNCCFQFSMLVLYLTTFQRKIKTNNYFQLKVIRMNKKLSLDQEHDTEE